MAEPFSLPVIRDPDEITQAPAQKQTSGNMAAEFGRAATGVYGLLDRVASQGNPFLEDVMIGVLEGAFQDAGMPVQLKTSGQRNLEALQAEVQFAELQQKRSALHVSGVVGELIDNAGSPAEEILGPRFAGQTLEKALGTKLDQSLLDDPERLVTVSQVLTQATGNRAWELKTSDLLNYRFTQERAQMTQTERAAQDTAESVKSFEQEEKRQEQLGQIQKGEGPVGQAFQANLSLVEDREDVDLASSFFGRAFDDYDDPKGAAAASQAILATRSQMPGLDDEDVLLGLLTGKQAGKAIASVLAGAETQESEGGRRVIKLDDPAVSVYAALVDQVSQRTKIPRHEILRRMGLGEGVDFDESQLTQAVAGTFAASG